MKNKIGTNHSNRLSIISTCTFPAVAKKRVKMSLVHDIVFNGVLYNGLLLY